jgi:hypothetical protein
VAAPLASKVSFGALKTYRLTLAVFCRYIDPMSFPAFQLIIASSGLYALRGLLYAGLLRPAR